MKKLKDFKYKEKVEIKNFGYPTEKIDSHVTNIQVKIGLKKKDLFYDRINKKNANLLTFDDTRANNTQNVTPKNESEVVS